MGEMRVAAIVAKPDSIIIAIVEPKDDRYVASFVDEWSVDGGDRYAGYGEIRTRLVARLASAKVDAVMVSGLEPFMLSPMSKARPNKSWFQSAELRGVVCEAARSVCPDTDQRLNAATNKSIGGRKKQDYEKDDAFWQRNFETKVLAKYRSAILVAISKIKESDAGA